MPGDARAQFAQRLGEVLDQHRNGNEPEADAPEAPETEVAVEEQHADDVTQDGPERDEQDDVQELEAAKTDLQPSADDAPEVATFKKEQLRRVEKALRKAASARKSVQGDPDASRKAAAYDLLMQNPELAAAVGKTGGGSRASGGGSDYDAEIAAIREDYVKEPQDAEGFDKIVRLIRAVTGKEAMPLVQAIHGLAGRTIDGDWEKLEKQYGDIADWKDATFATAKRLGIPLKKALLLESDGEIVAMQKQVSDQTKQRKSLTTPRSGAATGSYTREKPKAGGSTREDRVKTFAAGARKQGIDLPWLRFGRQG